MDRVDRQVWIYAINVLSIESFKFLKDTIELIKRLMKLCHRVYPFDMKAKGRVTIIPSRDKNVQFSTSSVKRVIKIRLTTSRIALRHKRRKRERTKPGVSSTRVISASSYTTTVFPRRGINRTPRRNPLSAAL